MAIKEISKDSRFIKVLAAQAANKPVEPKDVEEAAQICKELAEDIGANGHLIAQTIAYAVNELQTGELDFLNRIADIKNVGYNDKAMFNVKLGGVKAFIQAKGSTTARSYVADKQVTLDTEEISARPAINIVDLRAGRVNMADLIREANKEMTIMKLKKIEQVFHDAVDDFGSPYYGTGTGIVKATLDAQIAYFARLGPVTLLGDRAAVSQLAGVTGMVMNSGTNTDAFTQRSDGMIDEFNSNGFIGRYNGCAVIAMQNGYRDDETTPILDPNWIYIIPGGMTGDSRNLKVVNEGTLQSMSAQNIDDLTYEVRLDQWFGAAVVKGKKPTIGAYLIGA